MLCGFAPSLAALFSDEEPVRSLASTVLQMIAVTEPFYGVSIIIEGMMMGVGKPRAPFVYNVIGMWGVRIVGTFICTQLLGFGLVSAWACMIAHNLLLFVLFFFCYEICRWQGWKRFFLALGRIALFSILAIGMTAILELPALAALQTTQSSVNNFPQGFRLNIADENTWKGLLDAMRQVAGNMGGGLEPTFKEGLPNLYCGVGTITLCMAKAAGKVIGVEVIPQAGEDARDNAKRNGIENAEFFCVKVQCERNIFVCNIYSNYNCSCFGGCIVVRYGRIDDADVRNHRGRT